jgi:transposase
MEGAMAKYKHYDYCQRVLVPVSLEEQLMPGTLEFAIHTLVETRMDMSIFEHRYNNDETGRWAYDPKILLKVVLVGYARGLISSRKIERACRENITFMALSCEQCPDHSTIAAFVSSMRAEIIPLFRDVLLVCEEEGLLGGTFFALDGCKLPSNASKEWSGKITDLSKKKEKIEKKVAQLLEEQVDADKRESDKGKPERCSESLNRTKQAEKLQKKAERIEQWLQENGPKMGKKGREIKSNITDNESAMMVSSHGVIQGYNGQALVDGKRQVILHGEAFGCGEEHDLIPPMLEGAKQNIEGIGQCEDYFKGKPFTADSNYHSPTNLEKCADQEVDAYIPDKRFRKRALKVRLKGAYRSRRKGRFGLEDFQHNEAADEYVCPAGKVLKCCAKEAEVDGIIYRRYRAKGTYCVGCALRTKCIMGLRTKQRHLNVPIGSAPGNLTKAMAKKIDTEQGRRIYNQRIAIVEPVFANIRFQKGLDRFTLRGKAKATIQWLLYCMVHNIEKIKSHCFA